MAPRLLSRHWRLASGVRIRGKICPSIAEVSNFSPVLACRWLISSTAHRGYTVSVPALKPLPTLRRVQSAARTPGSSIPNPDRSHTSQRCIISWTYPVRDRPPTTHHIGHSTGYHTESFAVRQAHQDRLRRSEAAILVPGSCKVSQKDGRF